MSKQISAPFGSWASPITSDLIVSASISLNEVLLDRHDVYWIEGRPQEAGRYVLVHRQADGTERDVTPAPFSARTRVHEYGCGSAAVAEGVAYCSQYKDQRLYRIVPGKEPVPLTPAAPADSPQAQFRFADGLIDTRRRLWIGVREDHRNRHAEAVNTLVAIDLERGGEGNVLVGGNDFYSSARLSPDGQRLAWLAWDHPNMPWTSTKLWVGELTPAGIKNAVQVAGGGKESIFQPEWSPEGNLYFVSDRTGWWNLHRWEGGSRVTNVCPRSAEFGLPQWVFGMSTYAFLSGHEIVCAYIERGFGHLGLLEVTSGRLAPLDLPYTEFGSVRAAAGKVAFRAGSPASPPAIVLLDPRAGKTTVQRQGTNVADDPKVRSYFSEPRRIEFPTTGGKSAFALFYPPSNPDYEACPGEKAPLLVKCHGGPTGAASTSLDLRIQFWTSRGIGVVDVDYGGSTGYGREYRDRLELNWGIVDVDDCVAAAQFLTDEGLADRRRTVITGGSAGGFTVLACLAFRDYFRAGASHYGVSDLEALAHDTHKFESRYNDWLLGPYPQAKDLWRERSPVNGAERIKVPVAFFQGDEDEVVPPNQTELMVDALRQKQVPVLYLLFAGEQHGFRQAGNIKRALDAELYFYATQAFEVGLRF